MKLLQPSKAVRDWQIKTLEHPMFEAFLKSQIDPKNLPTPVFKPYDPFERHNPEINHAHKVMVRGVAILAILWLLVTGILIWQGETTQWATAQTKAAMPSIEVIP